LFSFGRKTVVQKSLGAKTRFGAVSLATALLLTINFHSMEMDAGGSVCRMLCLHSNQPAAAAAASLGYAAYDLLESRRGHLQRQVPEKLG